MKPGESFVGQPIRSLQTMLRTIAQVDPNQITVIPDGVYTSQTAAAVRSFQENNALPVTGTADQDTWDRIVSVYRPARVETDPAQPVFITLNPGQSFGPGQRHHHIYLTQAMLTVLAEAYPGLAAVPITGVYDPQTEEAVRTVQQFSGLEPTGILDKQTWKALVLHYGSAADQLERSR